MAPHSIVIAKASLAAGMIRPDPIATPKTEIAQFHNLLEAVLKQCSSANIQLCKDWLLKNVVPFAARITAIGKYLVALSLSLRETAEEDCPKLVQVSGPSGRRRQLHILYLLSDILHHTKFHIESSSAYLIWTNNIQVYLVDLFGAASAYSFERFAKHHKKIQDLLQIWKEKGYYQPSDIEKLRDTVRSAARLGYPSTGEDLKRPQEPPSEEKKDVPYLMPASHGDSSTPFYDLPAGNMMPHIKPNSSRTINPQNVKPLQFTAGPAEQKLVIAVKEFLAKVESMDSVGFGNEGIAMDIDELGQWTTHDEIAGVVTDGEGYYGWSRAFCENMKRRSDGIGGLERAVARDGSIERSLSPRKRRRYSDSGNSRNGEYNRQNVSSSRDASRQRMNRRSYSRSRSTSREPRQSRSFRSRSCTRSRSSSYSPPQSLAAFQPPAKHDTSPPPEAPGPPPPPPFPFLLPFSQGFPLGPGGIPVPPPPPPNYNGVWPPPPPPLDTGDLSSRPNLPPPTGPRTYNHGPPQFLPDVGLGFQGQKTQNYGGWSQKQQQASPGGSYQHGGRGRGQQAYDGSAQKGGDRRAWTK